MSRIVVVVIGGHSEFGHEEDAAALMVFQWGIIQLNRRVAVVIVLIEVVGIVVVVFLPPGSSLTFS